MPVAEDLAGRTFPPTPVYEVGREKIREFADAIGDPHPAYRDPEAARALGHLDVIAPPTFAIVVSMAADGQAMLDPTTGIDFARLVHAEQRFAYARPIVAGDRLVAQMTVERVRSAGGHDMVTMRSEVTAEDGDRVCTATSTIVVRGGSA